MGKGAYTPLINAELTLEKVFSEQLVADLSETPSHSQRRYSCPRDRIYILMPIVMPLQIVNRAEIREVYYG